MKTKKPLSPLPSQVELFSGICRIFGNRPVESRHINAMVSAANSILAEFNRERVPATPLMGLNAWLLSDDTGSSSKYLAAKLTGTYTNESFAAYPLDPADIGRCFRMLKAVPDAAKNFDSIAPTLPKPWPSLALKWEEFEALYNEESPTGSAPKLYAAMQKLYDTPGVLKDLG